MGWSIGHDSRWGKFGRDIGYGVPSVCDQPGCGAEIHRGLAYVCGSEPYGGDHGCGLFFCGKHRGFNTDCDQGELCERCAHQPEPAMPFEPSPDTREWIDWKLTDESWAIWRAENAEEVAAMRAAIQPPTPADETGEAEHFATANLPKTTREPKETQQ